MNPSEMLRIVDSLHREKNIPKGIVFLAIEAALESAARRQYGDEAEIDVSVDRETGVVSVVADEVSLDEEAIGRIGAQTAKQVIIQKIREAERDSLMEDFNEKLGLLVNGIVQRADGGATTVQVDNVEAILPRSEQIPGESHHPNERVRAVVAEVRAQGSRIKVVLSRTRPQLVQQLFEQEIPEIADGVIEINAISREPGNRSKVAVSSSDTRVDCVGACVGVRGSRIKNIVEELYNERIDIVRYSDDPEILIPNALQPAEVDQVLLCEMIGRAIVLVPEDQLSLAIGKRGQNVRLASKLCGWDIEIMTGEELGEQIERAVSGFSEIEGLDEDLAQRLVEQGYLSYDDLEVIEPEDLMEMGGLTAGQVDVIVEQAETRAAEAEKAATEERRRQREAKQVAEAEARAAEAAAREEQAAAEANKTDAEADDAATEAAEAEEVATEAVEDSETEATETVAEELATEAVEDTETVATEAEEAAEGSSEDDEPGGDEPGGEEVAVAAVAEEAGESTEAEAEADQENAGESAPDAGSDADSPNQESSSE